MPNDWGALLGGLAESGGRAFESARNFRFMAAQAALQQQLRQQGMELDQRAADVNERELVLRENEAKRKQDEYNALLKDIETVIKPETKMSPTRHPGAQKAIGKKIQGENLGRIMATRRLQLRTAPERALFAEQFEKTKPSDELAAFRLQVLQNPDLYPAEVKAWATGKTQQQIEGKPDRTQVPYTELTPNERNATDDNYRAAKNKWEDPLFGKTDPNTGEMVPFPYNSPADYYNQVILGQASESASPDTTYNQYLKKK